MYVCMHVYVYMTYVCVCLCVVTCVFVYVCAVLSWFWGLRVVACVYLYSCVCMCTYVCIHACMHVCMYACMCACQHKYICIRIFVRMCVYARLWHIFLPSPLTVDPLQACCSTVTASLAAAKRCIQSNAKSYAYVAESHLRIRKVCEQLSFFVSRAKHVLTWRHAHA